MTDKQVFVAGFNYRLQHPGAPCIPPASITRLRMSQKEPPYPGTSTIWIWGWKTAEGFERKMRI